MMQKITKFLVLTFFITISGYLNAQEQNVITSAAPFLTITPDGKGGAMGDVGVTSSPDVYSQYWNPAKYVFAESKSGIGISYTPWLSELASDIFVGYVSGYYKIDDRSSVSGSMRYFGLGQIQLTDDNGNPTGLINPNEYSFDVAYGLKLDDRFSMAISLRYIQSNIASSEGFNGVNDVTPGRSVGIDANKLLVVTSPYYKDQTNPSQGIGAGKDPNVGVIEGMFQSFYDAPGYRIKDDNDPTGYKTNSDGTYVIESGSVLKEELSEITLGVGVEYVYDKTFALRGGYFHENEFKGSRKYATLGFGFMYHSIGLDFSYLLNMSDVKSPLENTLRFSLSIDLGSFSLLGEKYDEE